MRKRFETRTIIGVLIWIGLLSGGWLSVRRTVNQAPQAASQLAQFIGNQRYTVRLDFENSQVVSVGDPVFLANQDQYETIGVVSRVQSNLSTTKQPVYCKTAFVTFYGNAPQIDGQDYLSYHIAEDSSGWVLQTMLPPAKREEIGNLILGAYAKNQADIVDAIRPILEQSLLETGHIVKDDLKAAFARRETRLKKISDRYQTELIEEKLVPLLQNEIWPIVQEECQPLAKQIGQEIWQEVSVFRFGWRYLYDRTPLPEQKLAEREFARFVDQKVIPILKTHLKELVAVQQTVIEKISKNERVRATFSLAINTVANDAELQEILSEVFHEVFVDNARLKAAVAAHWKTPAAQQAIALTHERIEPTITEIGIALFGSPSTKITPEFARVVRHRILHKDSRWFTLHVDRPEKSNASRRPHPETIAVRIAEPVGEIPFAPSRDRPE